VSTLVDLFGHDSLASGKIVEGAKRVPQLLQRCKSGLSPPSVFPSGKEVRKKFDDVAQVFRPHAEAMPLLRAKVAKLLASLAKALAPSRQYLCSVLCDLALTHFL
jgi:hypothetical protein